MTDEARLKKKILTAQPEFGPTGLNQAQNQVFRIFLELDHKFSLKLNMTITCDISNI